MTAIAIIGAFVLGLGVGAFQGVFLLGWAIREAKRKERTFHMGGDQ